VAPPELPIVPGSDGPCKRIVTAEAMKKDPVIQRKNSVVDDTAARKGYPGEEAVQGRGRPSKKATCCSEIEPPAVRGPNSKRDTASVDQTEA